MVAVASVKGAPGATTVAVGLAACGAGLVVEADPHGGDLAARFGHADSPGVSSAAAAARHGTGAGWLDGHVQRLALGIDVLLAPPAAEPASAAVGVLAGHGPALRAAVPLVAVDVGRLVPGSPAAPLVEAADVLLVVAFPTLECLSHVASRLAAMTPAVRARVRLVLAAAGGYPDAEISGDLQVVVAARLPRDRRGAAVLSGGYPPVRGWRRLRLPRALAQLAAAVSVAGPGGPFPRAGAVRAAVEVTG